MARHADRRPTHPGALFREVVLPSLRLPKTQVARLLGVSRESLYRILDEKQPVTPAMAVKLGKLCGNGGRLWAQMQTHHDLWIAEREVDTSKIPTLAAA
jgi:antitoxin HigA-1